MSYLSALQINQLLRNDWFTIPMSSHVHNYAMYRGRVHATVLTLRFNITRNFNEEFMIESVIQTTINQFSSQRTVLGLIEYDLLLKDRNSDSFYIWRANSNVARNIPNSEQSIQLNYDELYIFIRNAARVNPSDLNIYFNSSNVVVDRVLAIVFTFISQ